MLPAAPDPLTRSLRPYTQIREIDSRDSAIGHPHDAVDDHCLNVVPDTAFDQTFDGIVHRPVAQRVSAA